MINKRGNIIFNQFVLKLVAFFFVVFMVDLSIGFLLKRYYFKQESGNDYQATYVIDKTEAEILIFGSSRAANIYDPRIFESQLNLTCYNAGRYGYPIFYHYGLLKASIKRHVPKIVILSIDAGNFSINQEAYDRLSSLLPYYKDHPEIRPVVNLKGRYEKLKMISSIYPYNSLVLPIIQGNASINKLRAESINGYIALTEITSGPLATFDYTLEKKLDSVKINTYRNFIRSSKEAGIQLLVVCPPYLVNATGTDLSIQTAKQIAAESNVTFLDYSSDTLFTSKPYLFADYRHLNEKGVELISNSVIEKIKQLNK